MIEMVDVVKKYGDKLAVDHVSLTIREGELFAFLGPNGAGKTTTIKLLCNLLFPNQGTIRIGGLDLRTHGEQARRMLSYVPDLPFLYEKLTGLEFLEFIGDVYGMNRDLTREKIQEVSALFQLDPFLNDLTERYSHGMRQRTVFAAALLHDPKILIVDEPTVGLDPKSVRQLKDTLRKQADMGKAIFLSSHSLDIVEELADTIGIIFQGRLIAFGSLEAIKNQAEMDGSLEQVFLKMTEESEEIPQKPTGVQGAVS
ncbi:MAG: ABC transporter ATP-binding protein [Gemmataceae bacterium]|nr:ABC transporter ATP-binding protein [Gemmataceae bacterium]